jgi:nicotinic acetylcholine receptor
MKFFAAILLIGLIAIATGSSKVSRKGASGDAAGRAEVRKKIFSDYDKMNIPDDVAVKFGVSLLSVDANEEKSSLAADVWLKFMWTDSRLQWDNTTNKVNALRIGSQEIWKPDITLFNSANLKDMVSCWDSNPIVYPSGQILWVPPCQAHAHCNFTLDRQPYGPQKCQLKFGSWTYDAFSLDLDFMANSEAEKKMDVDYFGSTEWKIVGNTASRNEKYYPCCEEPYIDITYDLTIQRHEYFSCKKDEL